MRHVVALLLVAFVAALLAPLDRAGAAPVAVQKRVKLTKVVLSIPLGETVVERLSGWDCAAIPPVTSNGGRPTLTGPTSLSFEAMARDAAIEQNIAYVSASDDLFNQAGSTPDYDVAGVITSSHSKICTQSNGLQRATVDLAVDWQLFSILDKSVVARVATSATVTVDPAVAGGATVALSKAFRANAEKLWQSPEVRSNLVGTALADDAVVAPPTDLRPLKIAVADAASTVPINETPQSTVQIVSGLGTGSGVLISRDGYVVTAAHVVGDAPRVKLRWFDGTETDGEVVRIHAGRDVALIRTNSRGRTPLQLMGTAPKTGAVVFAVGTPLDKALQGTVTRGVLSGRPHIKGYAYLQSDATVNPGGSGGPLVDEQGRVIGLTVSGIRGGVVTGLNFFIPAADLIAFLGLVPG